MKFLNTKYSKLKNFKKKFLRNTPFPHLVMDNFFENSLFEKIDTEILQLNKKSFFNKRGKFYNTSVEKNKWISKNINLPKNINKVLRFLNSNLWIKNLMELSEINDLFGVEVINKNISNFHSMSKNGFLGSHVDHSIDPKSRCPHVMNIIIFLTKNWKNSYGGNTLFYNSKGSKIIKKILYKPNRAVIFLHTPYSFHGVSKIINNKSIKRSTIYVDYFSKSLEPYEHMSLPFSNKWFLHDTCFKLPSKLDYFKLKNSYYLKSNLKYYASKFFK
jgi:Rps23 Pro-64 3,4-dihydroxylase Tpa1-like proline 4-hydroxylase